MDGTPSLILANDLYARLGTAPAAFVFNVRRRNAFGADDRLIASRVKSPPDGNGSMVREQASRLSCIERAAEN
jgi:hypothetical protein